MVPKRLEDDGRPVLAATSEPAARRAEALQALYESNERAPGSARWRFRRSETKCGQGQDRTVDLPLMRSTALSAVQTCENGRH